MGKDGTQLLRHCVRLLVRVSTDLHAVRVSGTVFLFLLSFSFRPFCFVLFFLFFSPSPSKLCIWPACMRA